MDHWPQPGCSGSPFHYFVKVQSEFWAQAHPLESCWLTLHGAASFAWLFLLGTVAFWRSWRAWQARRNRFTGAAFAAVNLLLAATGYLLYHAGGEALRGAVAVLHWPAGLAFAAFFAWHACSGRLSRNGG